MSDSPQAHELDARTREDVEFQLDSRLAHFTVIMWELRRIAPLLQKLTSEDATNNVPTDELVRYKELLEQVFTEKALAWARNRLEDIRRETALCASILEQEFSSTGYEKMVEKLFTELSFSPTPEQLRSTVTQMRNRQDKGSWELARIVVGKKYNVSPSTLSPLLKKSNGLFAGLK